MKKVILILVLIACALGAVFLMKTREMLKDYEGVAAFPERVLDLTVEDIIGVDIFAMHAEYSLTRVSDEFHMVGDPNTDRVDQQAVTRMLERITTLTPQNAASEMKNIAFGPGSYESLTVRARQGRAFELQVNMKAVTNELKLVRVVSKHIASSDNPKYLISTEDYQAIMPRRKALMKQDL